MTDQIDGLLTGRGKEELETKLDQLDAAIALKLDADDLPPPVDELNDLTDAKTDNVDFNMYLGQDAGNGLTSGTGNTGIGHTALTNSSDGLNNTAVGYIALYANTSGSGNTACGASAGYANTTGDANAAMGGSALYQNQSGDQNTACGTAAGFTLITGSNNVMVGYFASPSAPNATNQIAIGHGAVAAMDNSWLVGVLGTKQTIKEGVNAAMGVATLVAGTVTVANALITANSRIFITGQDDNGGTAGAMRVASRIATTSFTITSDSGADTSIVAWEIKEPA